YVLKFACLPRSLLFPYTPLFRALPAVARRSARGARRRLGTARARRAALPAALDVHAAHAPRRTLRDRVREDRRPHRLRRRARRHLAGPESARQVTSSSHWAGTRRPATFFGGKRPTPNWSVAMTDGKVGVGHLSLYPMYFAPAPGPGAGPPPGGEGTTFCFVTATQTLFPRAFSPHPVSLVKPATPATRAGVYDA